ncbi:KxYKxGKxW signal peptide domain-containing protein [Leuconostoc pseudomesenteroides]|uniref:KxYKxGKxW signal peptide domain-containing protein n=1 Tax=Leuconostoc pseudomesenteroides TaxID=33968 RepID=A0ABT6HC39_LEUPS|nr:KxYKxGKxW signal peptide domain-containing protein [Leuconostoc pseudomesenteroides]MDG9733658.1 KxYKxGKxW signal peptide domain-containing protein [Leuconostoc pseudomesenteroides]NKZ37245.1 KxYKxGKxW signal peptide domain-containing protein [Leuconostoc pseudomesenteroides]QQB26521.1 KxYKxGKxW signal peptide domain-containing protein [Leuconostoc pseudomesenteroides]
MENSKIYKLYKSGKLWVISAVAVAGVAVSANTTQVSADTVSNADTQAVKTTDTKQDDKQVQLTASSTDTATDKATTDDATKSATVSSTAEKSTVPTTAGTSVSQDQAKDAVDKAQDTVKNDADTASKAGVDVTTGKTTDVTINDDNASSKTNEVLSDLNKQDQAVKDATAKQQANDQAYDKATSDQKDATTKGKADIDKSTADLDKEVDNAKQAGIDVSVEVSKTAPEYKSLKGLEGQDLLDAMAYNIDLYNEAIAYGVATQNQDAQTLANLTAEYQKQFADYQAKKAAVDKANADKKAAYDKAVAEFEKAVNTEISMSAKTQTDASSGQYKTFMTSTVNQKTGEFTLEHDMNDGVHVIGHGVLKGKVNWKVVANGDGSETITVSSIELYSYTYTNYYQNSAVNQNINFHVYDLNGKELFSVYHDGNTTFTKNINSTTAINKTFTLAPNATSSAIQFLTVDDNWIWNTHGQVDWQIKNTNVAPKSPDYEQEPTAPVAPKVSVHNITVADMPTAGKPQVQKVDVHYYNIKKTPKVEKTATPATPKTVETASILPTTHANENQSGVLLSALAGLASLGLAFGISKKGKKQN